LFHRFVPFLAGCVLADAQTGKNVKAGLIADVALHRAKDGWLIRNFLNPSFSER
jgi:hypothetical protein